MISVSFVSVLLPLHTLVTFSGFSVGFCINEEEGYLLPTTARKITLPTFRLNAPVVIRAKVKEVRTKHHYSHTTEDTRHQRSKVGEDCSSLPASSSQRSSNQGP